jgi:ethanolamine utilization protein EutP
MKKRLMVLGPRGSSKTELIWRLEGKPKDYRRTANMVYRNRTLSVPGAYLECPWMYCHILAARQDANVALLVLGSQRKHRVYPPNFANQLRLPTMGVITYFHDVPDDAQLASMKKELLEAGVTGPILQLNTEEWKELGEIEHQLQEMCGLTLVIGDSA